MKIYKGFDKNLRCRGFQYEIGQEYTMDDAIVCQQGFHACEYPLDVLAYYPPIKHSRYCRVAPDGIISRDEDLDDSKIASSIITIGEEIGLDGLYKEAMKYTFSKTTRECKPFSFEFVLRDSGCNCFLLQKYIESISATTGSFSYSVATGGRSISATTGNRSVSSATGGRSISATTGNRSVSSATGDRSTSIATGANSVSVTTGDNSVSATTGCGNYTSTVKYKSISSATGNNSVSFAEGENSISSTTGNNSNSVAECENSISATTGDNSDSITTDVNSVSVTTGHNSASFAKGYGNVAVALGYNNFAHTHNETAIAIAWGKESEAMGCLGSYIVCSEWIDGKLKEAKMARVDGEFIKADISYCLINGKFTEVQ